MARSNRVTPGTPNAVKKAARRAEKLHKEMYGGPEDATQEPAAQDAVAPVENEAGAGGDIQPVEPQAQIDSTGDTPEPAPPTDPLVAAEPAPAEPAPAEAQPNPWEDKYKTLQGKYDSEVPAMHRQMNDMRRAMSDMQTRMDTPTPEPAPVAAKKSVVTEADILDYGEDLIGLIRRIAQGEFDGVAGDWKPEIEQIKGQIADTTAKQATNTIYDKLDRGVQDWREINKSAEFLAWLGQSDPYAGDIRQNLLAAAFQGGDAERVAAFFKGFLAERQLVSPTPVPSPQPAPAPESANNGQMSLEQLAGPTGGATTTPPPPVQQKAPDWTGAQVAAFYKDVNAGVYKSDPAKKAQIETMIAVAMKENRVH